MYVANISNTAGSAKAYMYVSLNTTLKHGEDSDCYSGTFLNGEQGNVLIREVSIFSKVNLNLGGARPH